MERPLAVVRRFFRRDRRHFTLLRERVARSNLKQLRRLSGVFAAFLAGYGLLTIFLFRSPVLTSFYGAFLVGALLFLGFSFRYRRRPPPSPSVIQRACMAFLLLAMAFVIGISVFPFPARPGIFFPLAYVLVIVLFQFPFWQLSLVLSGLTGCYLLLAVRFKTPEAAAYDAFAAATAWVLGFFFQVVVSDLRIRDGDLMLELERLSRTDPLTGLPNRRGMEEELSDQLRRSLEEGEPVSVMMLDVDRFKQYNDTLGHGAGDQCLRRLGTLLRGFAEERGLQAARYGGEEFLLLLPGYTREEAVQAGRELLGRVRALALPHPGGGWVTVSLGLAAGGQRDAAGLIRQADEALYRAKAQGRDGLSL